MTDKIDHYAESESLAATAGIRDSVDRMHATKTDIYLAAIHKSLLAIADALTAVDRYAANEAKQREAGADPLDEDDHRDRLDRSGDLVRRKPNGHWAWVAPGLNAVDGWTLSSLNAFHGPLAFAPDTAQEAVGGDLSAPQGESGAEERGDTDNAQNAILCPECGHHINVHDVDGCLLTRCDCPRTPEDVALALIAEAAKRGGRG